MNNNVSTFDRNKKYLDDSDLKIAVNSIQRTLFVERLYVDISYPADKIIPYDVDNLYPNKIKSIAQRSGTTYGSINTFAGFILGDGFNGMDMVVNREMEKLWDIAWHVSYSYSMFGGFALHFNYNIFGEIIEINPVNFEFVRHSKGLDKYVINTDWHRRNKKRFEKEYHKFNPKTVLEEIEAAGGINNYEGQIYYWIPNKKDIYTICTWDSALDDAQFEAEAKLYSLSSIQNDYSLSGIVHYPKNLTDSEEIDDLKENLQQDKGAANAGGTRVIGAMPSELANGWKWFTPISRNNIDALHTNQIERAKFNIYATFRQPPILNGVSTNGMFNQESFADAFHYYNTATETERKQIEKQLTKILSYSIWSDLGKVEIIPKTFMGRQK